MSKPELNAAELLVIVEKALSKSRKFTGVDWGPSSRFIMQLTHATQEYRSYLEKTKWDRDERS